jgi:hypothetical protein
MYKKERTESAREGEREREGKRYFESRLVCVSMFVQK